MEAVTWIFQKIGDNLYDFGRSLIQLLATWAAFLAPLIISDVLSSNGWATAVFAPIGLVFAAWATVSYFLMRWWRKKRLLTRSIFQTLTIVCFASIIPIMWLILTLRTS